MEDDGSPRQEQQEQQQQQQQRVSGRRPRSDALKRRPHSQPEKLLSVSCRNSSDSGRYKELGKVMHCEEEAPKMNKQPRLLEDDDKGVKVFKRREGSRAGAFVAEEEDTSKAGRKSANGDKTQPKAAGKGNVNGKSNGGNEKWAPKLKSKQPPDEKLPEPKRRRQRMILEGSDEEDSENDKKNDNNSSDTKQSPKNEESKVVPKAPPEALAVRKSSRVVKRRTFDDEIDFEEVTRRRRKPPAESREVPAKQVENCVEENTDSADDEQPRKKPKRGSIQELHSATKEKSRQKSVSVSVQETKPLTARQRAMQAGKEAQDQPSTSGRDDAQKAESPSDSTESKEKSATPLTARQRSLQACKDGEANFGLIEFPDGLNTTDRRRKARLTEEEKLARKAEAASKRKQQVEKAAKEIQASAIQKILKQDSNRKKREEKLQKQKQELAEEKKAAEMVMATNTVRWVMGPSGTTVSWAQDAEFPLLFAGGPVSYPPPREKCAACDNAYKYRDSKSNLPLCSLQCYKAMRQPPGIVAVPPAH